MRELEKSKVEHVWLVPDFFAIFPNAEVASTSDAGFTMTVIRDGDLVVWVYWEKGNPCVRYDEDVLSQAEYFALSGWASQYAIEAIGVCDLDERMLDIIVEASSPHEIGQSLASSC